MKIKLKGDWFAPSDLGNVGSGAIILKCSGRLYRGPNGPEGGVHTVPDDLKEFLPKSAQILDGDNKVVPRETKSSVSFKDFDFDRAAGEALDIAMNK